MVGPSKERLMKIIVVGDCGAGKTCLIRRFMQGTFQNTNKATIGVDFALKVVPQSNTTLQIWDIAGQERYGQMTRVYFLSALGAMVVAEIHKPETYEAAVKWKQDVDSKVFLPGSPQTPIPCLLLLNKSDLGQSHLSKDELDNFCTTHGFVGWFAVSAKEGTNVDDSFDELVRKVHIATEAVSANKSTTGAAPDRPDQNQSTVRLAPRRPDEKAPPKKKCDC